MDSPLKPEFEYYLANKPALLEDYKGKFVVIKGQSVIGAYDNMGDAFTETTKTHELGTFLVQEVKPGEDAETQTFHSRVVFLG